MQKNSGTIIRVSGPLVEAEGLSAPQMYEMVRVGKEKLMGEIIELKKDRVAIQVYEETGGIAPGEEVVSTGRVMSVMLGPGLLQSIYDGIQRPLHLIEEQSKSFIIARGIETEGIDTKKQWNFTSRVEVGSHVIPGDILGSVEETTLITHHIMVPPHCPIGKVISIESGDHTITDTIAVIEDEKGVKHDIQMLQYWPIRKPRPKKAKIFPNEPLITGFRILDTFFPVAKGGAAAIPGPFGSGKTVTQQGLAKYCDAQVIVYIGCGERGNEMTEVLNEFPHLIDPNSGEPLMKRTVLIANTSNMPVAAREASVYSGITIAEYYRDMGYSVALMADSTSRWAEALREISGRMEEMPGEEGYPAYLGSRTAEFYERAGAVSCLGSDDRNGALTVIGAVSPPGGDLSEPVSQATLRVTKCFWGLDAALAYRKHFPAINWLTSYSLYIPNVVDFWKKEVAETFPVLRTQALSILQKEEKLMEIVRLVGMESLSSEERLTLDVAKVLREDFLFQNAFDPNDAYTPIKKQYYIVDAIMHIFNALDTHIKEAGADFDYKDIGKLALFETVASLKDFDANDIASFEDYKKRIDEKIQTMSA